MRRSVIFTAASTLTLMAGMNAIAWRLNGRQQQPPPAPTRTQTDRARPPAEGVINFARKGALDYFSERGFRASSQSFEATDGVTVTLITERHESTGDAGEALRQKAQAASEIARRGRLLDRKGARVSERVVAHFKEGGEGTEGAMILRTHGTFFYLFESSSLRHLLLLEQELFPASKYVTD